MKRINNLLRLMLVTMMLVCSAVADETEGTSFWFGIPKLDRAPYEFVSTVNTNSGVELWITSETSTTARLFNSNGTLIRTIDVKRETFPYTVVPLDMAKECIESEVVYTDRSYYLESDDPVSVIVYMSFKWTGEAYRVIPDVWLGKKYFTLNLYQDECKRYCEDEITQHPSEIMIVATEDNTEVTYVPTWDTQSGVKAGEKATVTLNKGNTFLILGKIEEKLSFYDEADLTGTCIESTKPIAVYSGHTKGAYPRIKPTYYGLNADYLKNLMIEAMLPVEFCGNEYVYVPNKYGNREIGYQGLLAEERGDMLRFVATENNTEIYLTNAEGGKIKLVNLKKAGQWFQWSSCEKPSLFTSTKPVLVGQYGKGWMYCKNIFTEEEGSDTTKPTEDKLLPTLSGQGQFYTLTPTNRWADYAGFVSPQDVNNFFNLIFKTGDEKSIEINGTSLDFFYKTQIKEIPGTEYSYISYSAPTGENTIKAIKDGVKFALYAYGNMDAFRDGHAYGYTGTGNLSTPCEDGIVVEDSQKDNEIFGEVTAVNMNDNKSDCAKIQSVKAVVSSQTNAVFTPNIKQDGTTGTFTVNFFDKNKPGYLKLMFITKSGSTLTKEYSYNPENAAVENDATGKLIYVTPNPVVTSSRISYTVVNECLVTIEIFDSMGAKVTELVNEMKPIGTYETMLDANALGISNGTYTCKISMGDYSTTKSIVVTK